jgi:prevent-host-death family protein
MPKRASIHLCEATTHLAQLLDCVERGEEVVITQNSRPAARLVPIIPARTTPRRLGALRGKIRIAADFDAPLGLFDD